jgi:hypothetical protein
MDNWLESWNADFTETSALLAEKCSGDPVGLGVGFVGWMSKMHDGTLEMNNKIMDLSEAQFAMFWAGIVIHFVRRYNDEMAGPDGGMIFRAEIGRMIGDFDAMNEEVLGQLEKNKEDALDQAVSAVREGEEAGRASVDPRSDDEIRESFREMW